MTAKVQEASNQIGGDQRLRCSGNLFILYLYFQKTYFTTCSFTFLQPVHF